MTMTRFQKITLGIAGVTALAVGASILVAPHAFYAGYGIVLGSDPALLSELRAPAANLAALGMLILAGLVRPTLARMSATIALIVFIAFPIGRVVSLAVDGSPSSSALGALAIEVAIGGLCLLAFGRRRGRGATRQPLADVPG